ncbi:M28 family metallopeptidase [Halorarius halobius]|uniref:M28 family metallopeptidase n=1 Tax=Halorarius halobius TaxID=2962671 RepID=UPI0020CF603F|nr:M28 family metallopeptidase [Halorarius halobius]
MDDTARTLAGRAFADPFPWRFLTDLVEAGPRLGGSPGERRAADLVADALGEAGADPKTRPFEMRRWTRGDAALAAGRDGADRSFETVALPYSPPGDVTGDIVDVGHGTPDEVDDADVDGKVVVADTDTPPGDRFVHRMEKFGHAVDAGAAAFVFAHHEPGQLIPTGTLRFGREAAVPGIGVSHETGEWLREYAGDGRARIRVDATTEAGTSHTVVGSLGPDTEEAVLVVAHLDAHDVAEGALDNGCGITTAVTAARYLADCELDCEVVVAGVGCEETGLLGSRALAEDLDVGRLRAVVNVDGAGRHRDLRALTHGHDGVRDLAERVVDEAGHPLAVGETPHPYSDHWPFLREGVPALQLHSKEPGTSGRGRGWTHTAADTRDKVDPRTLRSHALLTALLVRNLTRADLDPVDTAELREKLEDAGAESGMRAAGVWPEGWN